MDSMGHSEPMVRDTRAEVHGVPTVAHDALCQDSARCGEPLAHEVSECGVLSTLAHNTGGRLTVSDLLAYDVRNETSGEPPMARSVSQQSQDCSGEPMARKSSDESQEHGEPKAHDAWDITQCAPSGYTDICCPKRDNGNAPAMLSGSGNIQETSHMASLRVNTLTDGPNMQSIHVDQPLGKGKARASCSLCRGLASPLGL